MINKRWSGNFTTDLSLCDDYWQKIYDFCRHRKNVYVFGNGKIGTALVNYLNNAEIKYAGIINSQTLDTINDQNAGIIVAVGDEYYDEVLPTLQRTIREDDLLLLSQEFKVNLQFQSPLEVKDLFHLNIFTTTKCNLFCKSCSTFAPLLADNPTFYDYKLFAADLMAFTNLDIEKINVIKFTGGEPFLHPQLFEMFAFVRELFPAIPMECYTNGSLLAKMPIEKLEMLKLLEIVPVITEYPPLESKLNDFYAAADELGLKYNVIFAENTKIFSKRPLNLHKSTPKHLYASCPRYKCTSVFLWFGRLYKCVYCMLSKDFSNAVGQNFDLVPGDFLDVYNTNQDELYDFIISRKPFCGYCSPITEIVPWSLSECKIEEWT